jgi:hypothetical protein
MSGPKVVRIVTREEIEAICRRHISAVAFAAELLRRRARRCGLLDETLEKAISSRLSGFESKFASERWMDIQKGAPEAAAFMLAEADRLETSATAIAVRVRERGRRAADAARSLVSALETAGVPIPAGLRAAGLGKAGSPEEAEKSVAAALRLVPATQLDAGATAARNELAARLGSGEQTKTIADLIAGRATEPTATERRLDALIAELGILGEAAGFSRRADEIMLESDASHRALLSDSLVMDAAAHVVAVRRREASSIRLMQAEHSLNDVPGPEAEALRGRLSIAAREGIAEGERALVSAAADMVDEHVGRAAAAARRRVVLAGLASLGYEIRETMSAAWERNGRLVVRKPGTTDYGVELGAPADVARLQVRLVGSDRPLSPRDARSDADQETIWCSEFNRFRAGLAANGAELIVESALRPGELPLRTVSMPSQAPNELADPARTRLGRQV